MEETLKTARFVHRLLIGACAALVAFGATKTGSRLERDAAEELDRLLRLESQRTKAWQGLNELAQEVIERERLELMEELELYANATTPILLGTPSFELTIPRRWNARLLSMSQSADIPLGELIAAVREGPALTFPWPDDLDLSEKLLAEIGKLAPGLCERTWSREAPVTLESIGMSFSESSPTQDKDSNGASQSDDEEPQPDEVRVSASFCCPGDSKATDAISFSADVSGLPVTTKYRWSEAPLADWTRAFGTPITLESLESASRRHRLSDLNAGAALVVLSLLDSAQDESLELLGLKVDRGLALTLGPFLIAVVLTYLLVHLRHVERSCSIATADEIRAFPWMSTFDDAASRALVWISLVAFPGLAIGIPLSRNWISASPLTWVSVALGLGTLSLGIANWRVVRALQTRLAAPPDAGA